MDVDELIARQEITDLITRYTRAVDTSDWDGLDTVFTPEAILDYSDAGGPVCRRDEAKQFLTSLEGFERWQHLVGQVSIEFDTEDDGAGAAESGPPSRARATAYFFNPMTSLPSDKSPDRKPGLHEVGGYYHHTLVRTPDGWRSVHMVDEFVWSRGW